MIGTILFAVAASAILCAAPSSSTGLTPCPSASCPTASSPSSASARRLWCERDRHALREFWVRALADALGVTGFREGTGAERQAAEITQPRERQDDSVTGIAQHETPHVGIFWLVQIANSEVMLLAACPLDQAEPYGDCLTFGPGHYELWAQWRRDRTVEPTLRAIVRSYEYEDWPRGRIVFDRSRDLFIIYADRKLMTPATIARIGTQFHLLEEPPRSKATFTIRARRHRTL
jgi:hypothetical protein